MRARVTFTTSLVDESLIAILKEHKSWIPDQHGGTAQKVVETVQKSLDPVDEPDFEPAKKLIFIEGTTETPGVLSFERDRWLARLVNPNVPVLQICIENMVEQMTEHARRNKSQLQFINEIQIVEIGRKITIIEGTPLVTRKERSAYARTHRWIELVIALGGLVILVALLAATYPYQWRNLADPVQAWKFSVLEKMIGSVAVTSFLAGTQYLIFKASLRDHTVKWAIPGQQKKHEIRSRAM